MIFRAVLIFAALAFSAGSVLAQVPPAGESRGYTIGPGDKVVGKVLGEPNFSFEAIVDEDGKIQVPFSNDGIVAKCKTEKELRAEVAKYLSKYLRSPQLSVNVTERNSRPPATVYGEVKNPQRFVLTRRARLLELLSFSGGVTEKAGGMIQVVHTQPPVCAEDADYSASDENLFVPRLYSLNSVKQATDETNPLIFPGDLVVVMKAPPVYVIGEVSILREILITESGLSLTEAIAQAGGFNREARKKDIIIQRLKSNSRERENITVNYDAIKRGEEKDVMLQPEDIVIVNKTKKSIGETVLEIVTGGAKNAANLLPTVIL